MPDKESQTVAVPAGEIRAPATILWTDRATGERSVRLVEEVCFITFTLSREGFYALLEDGIDASQDVAKLSGPGWEELINADQPVDVLSDSV